MSLTSERIKELREKNQLTQTEVAEKLGLSASGYRKFEYGERDLNVNLLRDMALFYNVSSDYLIGLSNMSNDLNGKSLTVVLSRNEMLSKEIIYNSLMKSEGEGAASTNEAYRNFIHSQGFYNKILFEYIQDYFEQPSPQPEEDLILRETYPISFQIQEDLFSGVTINVVCADGYIISNIKHFVGGFALQRDVANEKAEKYIYKMKNHLKLE